MKLLVERLESTNVIQESNDSNDLYIKGPFIQMNVVNGNRRLYPKHIVIPEVERYIKEHVETNRAIGELNHPGTPHINYERACIKIESLVLEGDNFIGRAKVLKSVPLGSLIAGLISEGVQIAVSTRGLGSVKPDASGVNVVQSFKLITAADVVHDPSGPDAYVTALMENKEWVFENGVIVESHKRIVDDSFKGNATYDEKCLLAFQRLVDIMTKS